MSKSALKNQKITQKNDASSIGNKRGMARRAKKNSSHRDRQRLKEELRQAWREAGSTPVIPCGVEHSGNALRGQQ